MEIGLNNGYSTVLWLSNLPNTKLHSVDIGIHPFIPEVQNKLKQHFKDRFSYETLDSTLLKNDKPIYDLIIIDGGHHHDICLSDLKFSIKHSKYILLDDTGGKSPGVTSALKEFNKHYPNALKLIQKWNIEAGCHLYENISNNKFIN